jgi:hypothetical protein
MGGRSTRAIGSPAGLRRARGRLTYPHTVTGRELRRQLHAATPGHMRKLRRTKKLEPISVRLDPDVRKAVETLAKSDDRSLSAYINRVLRLHVETVAGNRATGAKT